MMARTIGQHQPATAVASATLWHQQPATMWQQQQQSQAAEH